MEAEILAEVTRGETIESVHRGHLIVLDGDEKVIASVGNPETVTFFRSAAKALQAIPFITSGAAESFGFSERQIALACASHSGENVHTKIAAEMLEKIGLTESDLNCGAHAPFNESVAEQMIRDGEKPSQLHNNCSGKHAAMLAFAKHTGAEIGTYERLENPVQRKILETISIFTDVPVDEIKIGIDGCNAPNFALSLKAMAKSFVRLVNPPGNFDEKLKIACRKIVAANLEYPELIGGSERLDTILMRKAKGEIISKIGAEGVWLCGVLPSAKWKTGLGVAVKIEDGDDKRARAAISIEILKQLGILRSEDLRDYSPLPIKNRRGDVVGRVEAKFRLKLKQDVRDERN